VPSPVKTTTLYEFDVKTVAPVVEKTGAVVVIGTIVVVGVKTGESVITTCSGEEVKTGSGESVITTCSGEEVKTGSGESVMTLVSDVVNRLGTFVVSRRNTGFFEGGGVVSIIFFCPFILFSISFL
jgi:hypothetical protein